MKKKIAAKRLSLSKETVTVLENGDLKNMPGGGSNTCAFWITGDKANCVLVQCA